MSTHARIAAASFEVCGRLGPLANAWINLAMPETAKFDGGAWWRSSARKRPVRLQILDEMLCLSQSAIDRKSVV